MNSQDIRDYVERLQNIENEISLLQIDKKTLNEEFKEKIDLKAIKAALQIAKIRSKGDEGLIDLILDEISKLATS